MLLIFCCRVLLPVEVTITGWNSLGIYLPFQFENSTLQSPETHTLKAHDMDFEDIDFCKLYVV
jgi:hypothetical protein